MLFNLVKSCVQTLRYSSPFWNTGAPNERFSFADLATKLAVTATSLDQSKTKVR